MSRRRTVHTLVGRPGTTSISVLASLAVIALLTYVLA
jgi:hypothetical protein